MSCFLVPAAAALATTIVSKAASKKQATEKQTESGQNEIAESRPHHSFKAHLNWLMTMLWGGAILLALEHFWHGEIVLAPPFLTAVADPAAMVSEMATVGVAMTAIVCVAWVVMVLVSDYVKAHKYASVKTSEI